MTVIDHVGSSFGHLDPAYRGRTIEAEPLAEGVLEKAGIRDAQALAAVTNSDAVNAVVAHVARTVYGVPNVVARNYDPRWLVLHEAMGLVAVSSTAWGAQRIEELLERPRLRPVFSAGNGEVELYELPVPERWVGRTLGALVEGVDCVPVSLTHGGRASLPEAGAGARRGRHRARHGHRRRGGDGWAGAWRRREPDAHPDRRGRPDGGDARPHPPRAEARGPPHRASAECPRPHPPRAAHRAHLRGQPDRPADPGARPHRRRAGARGLACRATPRTSPLCFIAREHFKVPRTIATINDPRFAWLFGPRFHVDVAVNQADILASLIEQELSVGDMMTLLKLRRGSYSLVSETLAGGAPAVGRALRDLAVPEERGRVRHPPAQDDVVIPRGDVRFQAGDEVLALVDEASAPELAALFGSPGNVAAGAPAA